MHYTKRCSRESRNTQHLNDKRKSAGTHYDNKHVLLGHSNANGTSRFESLLIHDIVKTSAIPKSRIAIDEIVIVRQDRTYKHS